MRTAWIVVVAACIVGLAAPVAAQDRDSLTGIGPITVSVAKGGCATRRCRCRRCTPILRWS